MLSLTNWGGSTSQHHNKLTVYILHTTCERSIQGLPMTLLRQSIALACKARDRCSTSIQVHFDSLDKLWYATSGVLIKFPNCMLKCLYTFLNNSFKPLATILAIFTLSISIARAISAAPKWTISISAFNCYSISYDSIDHLIA